MLSAVKNFAITFAASALIFGIIAYFVAGAVENGITAAGNDTDMVTDLGTGDNADVDFVYVTDENGEVVTDENGLPVTEVKKDEPPVVDDIKGNSFNMLLVGTDYQPAVLDDYDLTSYNENVSGFKVKERTINADTIVLIRVDKELKSFIFLPIPSNTQVFVSGMNMTLGSLYDRYGLDYLCKKVWALTGLNVDYYCCMSIPNLTKVIDIIGGISYMVPTDMTYNDESQDLSISLKKGQQTLSGDHALQMLRYCSYSDGYISRMSLGVDFIKSIASKLTSSFYLEKAAEVFSSVVGYAETNFTLEDLTNNLDLIFSYSSFNKIDLAYPGVTKTENDVYYFVPSYTEAITKFREYR